MSRKNRPRNTSSIRGWRLSMKALCVVLPGFLFGVPVAHADGTDILGPTTASLETGSAIIGAGIGLSLAQPGNLEVEIPAGVTVQQVLLYWDGADQAYAGGAPIMGTTSNTIQVNGTDVPGEFIGGRAFLSGTQLFTYRADITDLGLVAPGSNSLSIGNLDFGTGSVETGAGVLVVVDDGTSSTLTVFDGNDYAYHACVEDAGCPVTVQRSFTFPAASTPRDAALTMFFTSVAGEASSGDLRPSLIEVSIGGAPPIQIVNQLDSVDGEEWDTVELEFEIPAGVTQVDVQAFSEDLDMTGDDPASFKWLTAALSVPDEVTGGQGCTPGYWRQDHHFADWTAPYAPDDLFSEYFEDAFPGSTLHDVVQQGGGGLTALGRHTVAALLNAANPEVSYDLAPQDVISAFNDLYPEGSKEDYEGLKDEFEAFNEQGCPLNNSDGSNGNDGNNGNNGNANGNVPEVTFTIEETLGMSAVEKNGGGGGALGIGEMLALLFAIFAARLRARRTI